MLNNHSPKSTNLADLTERAGGEIRLIGGGGVSVSSVEYDSRNVKKGSLFVAVDGMKTDGHRYIDEALGKGAASICVSLERAGECGSLKERGIGILGAENTRGALSRLSAALYGFPSRSMIAIGITGTNGKTSITYMLESVLKRHGFNPGVIGTVNYRWGGRVHPAPNTTPESRDLHEMMYRMGQDGVNALVMEVSSHGLELGRADDIDFDIALFTNLTRDHLDFHHDFESYFNAKKRLFSLLDGSGKKGRCGIVNSDDSYGSELYMIRNHYSYPFKSFGADGEADYMPLPGSIENTLRGVRYIMERPQRGVEIALRLPGRFQVYNSLAAVAAAHHLGVSFEAIAEGLADLESVPGRFDVLLGDGGYAIVVDYAHTVDALLKLLKSARELEHRRLITVFGCGGDRDRTKRPLMGKVAEENSDVVIITSDNPRGENPESIIANIVAGMTPGRHEIVPDREEAIRRGIELAGEGDIVVIAGKGHEDYQIIGTEKKHFDDKETAARWMRPGAGAGRAR
ncbi:MAG: UDP-N-acetylmuramoyl-L-alanyl-D-glutamate--2,6-diaminopimelate ligase [Spirochaetes bacterium]|nr:UDP-N-acetylmuramoyl-L-alanyl-D-glutamate--2,6-diaminopimelate ligase [Spirochaetota bacterium]